MGRTVVRVNGRPLEEAAGGASIQVSPILGRDVRGVRLTPVFQLPAQMSKLARCEELVASDPGGLVAAAVRGHGAARLAGVALLRPRDERPDFATRRRIHTVVRCPLNGHQAGACRGLCEPSPEGEGLCGRLAAHALVGRTQAAIAAHEAEQRAGALWVRPGLPQRPPRTLARPDETRRGF